MQTGKLPEKPWRTEAVGRFLASIFMCWLCGMVILTMLIYFQVPQKSSTAAFLAYSTGTLACFAGSIVVIMRPWQFESLLHKLLMLLLFLYGGFLLMWLAQRLVTNKDELGNSIVTLLIGVLAFQGAVVALVHFFLREHHAGGVSGFGFDKSPWLALLFGACVGFFALWATQRLLGLSSEVLELLKIHPQEQETVTILRGTDDWKDRVLMAVATIAIAPLGEEILFRGILYPWIKRISSPQIALWITALVFAAIHLNLAAFVPLVFLAIVLVALYEYTGNLLACIVTHMFFNAANFIALYTYLGKK